MSTVPTRLGKTLTNMILLSMPNEIFQSGILVRRPRKCGDFVVERLMEGKNYTNQVDRGNCGLQMSLIHLAKKLEMSHDPFGSSSTPGFILQEKRFSENVTHPPSVDLFEPPVSGITYGSIAITAVVGIRGIIRRICPSQGFVDSIVFSWSKCCWQTRMKPMEFFSDEQMNFSLLDAFKDGEIERLWQNISLMA
ncbi:hypothetical protein Tco_0939649 [Tanacetum coccineum]|uniref:Uncharacterized protein n=1 Tax=Tanacetum coccineum TaxID=301880 RepID=A0ABQ5DLD8_9ASTR